MFNKSPQGFRTECIQAKSLCTFGFLIFITLLLTSCVHQKGANTTVQSVPLGLTEEEKARLQDIPFPRSSRSEFIENTSEKKIISLKAVLPIQDVSDFYRVEMEYYGWHQVADFTAPESCMLYEKPSKRCCIVLRSINDNESSGTIYIGQK